DRLQEKPPGIGEDRRDRVDELGEVGDAHRAAVADEAVQVGGDSQGVREVVAFLHAAHAVLVAARSPPDVPLVEGDVDGMRDPLRVAHALDQGRADPDRALGLVRLEHRGVVVGAARVEVDRVEVDELGEAGQRDLVPLAPAVLATADELDRRIGALHDHGERARLLHVVVRIHVADLPAAVHLVAECPVAHAIGLGVSVLAAQIRPRGVADAVAVLDPRLGLVHRARAHVHADERLGAEHAAILDELVGAEAIRLLGIPRQLAAPRSLVSRPDAVEPVVAAHEVAAGPAEDRDAQGSRGIERVAREPGIRVEQQRLPWADLYPKLQVSVPAGEGPDLALIHTVEVPHFANDGVLEAIDEATATGKGFRGDGYLPATWQGGTFQGKRYSLPLDVPQHLLYLNVKVMKEAGLVGADGKPKVPASRDELVTMAK